jgi:hypothetical protein
VRVALQGTPFQTRTDASREFEFAVVYRTPTCRVTLTSGSQAQEVLIANCAPGLMPRGSWSPAAQYSEDDVVLFRGSTYRAMIPNRGKRPDVTSRAWGVLAARGPAGTGGEPLPEAPPAAIGAPGPNANEGQEANKVEREAGGAGLEELSRLPEATRLPGALFGTAAKKQRTCSSRREFERNASEPSVYYCVVRCDRGEVGVYAWFRIYDRSGQLVRAALNEYVKFERSFPANGRYAFWINGSEQDVAEHDYEVGLLCGGSNTF